MASSQQSYFVILAGRYCTAEISAEFGQLPPSFLPLGDARLLKRQLQLAKRCNGQPVISIPADYQMPHWDEEALEADGVRVVRTPSSLTLNEAVQFVLEVLDAQGPLYMLYGDTLIEGDRLTELDQAAIQLTLSNYTWSEATVDAAGKLRIRHGYGDGVTRRRVLCGYFSFSNAKALRMACVEADDFDQSIETYSNSNSMRLIEVREWHDFGHLSLIYRSRRNVMVSRSFNSVRSDGVSLVKTSDDHKKIAAEAAWYAAIPEEIKLYTPHFLGHDPDTNSYRLEYLYLPTLAELYTYGELPGYVWRQILESCLDFMRQCWQHRPSPDAPEASRAYSDAFFDNLFRQKTRERVEAFRQARGWAPDMPLSIDGRVMPSMGTICDRLLAYISPTQPDDIRAWHGDFFFGNILYDFRAARVRVIDPRGGATSDAPSVWGDYRYDIAKLAHSVIGGYDALLAGCVDFDRKGPGAFHFDRRWTKTQREIAKVFALLGADGERFLTDEIKAMTALLFLTMLPLHADDPKRQDIMLCSGLILAHELLTQKED